MRKNVLFMLLAMILCLSFGSAVLAGEQSGIEGTINFQMETQTLEFKGYSVGTDFEGKPALVLIFDYCNLSDESNFAASDFYIQVFQNGIERDQATLDFDGEWGEAQKNYTTEIKDGAKLTVCVGYLLNDVTSPVDIEAKEFVNWEDEQKMAIDIAQFSEKASAAESTDEPETSPVTQKDVIDWEAKYNDLKAEYDDLKLKYDALQEEYDHMKAESTVSESKAEPKKGENATVTESVNTTSEEATAGQKNALRSAEQYLNFTAFSYKGLIEQLEYEQYLHEDAVYAADHCGADWNEQAAKAAANYLEYTSFSRDGLIEQLEYEGYTHEQAVYGAEQNGY